MELLVLLVYIGSAVLGYYILYRVIKAAVREGIQEAEDASIRSSRMWWSAKPPDAAPPPPTPTPAPPQPAAQMPPPAGATGQPTTRQELADRLRQAQSLEEAETLLRHTSGLLPPETYQTAYNKLRSLRMIKQMHGLAPNGRDWDILAKIVLEEPNAM